MLNPLKTSLFLALSACCASQVIAQSPKKAVAVAAPEKISTIEGITEYRFKNGLKVLLFPDQTKQTATVNVTYLVGSKFENYGETGMAHLLEHMVFKGTPKHPDIPNELSVHGARPNGSTFTDRTNYYETFSATDENMNWALDMEADRMVNSYIAKVELDKEFSVVRNEMESGENDPSNVLFERLMSTAYLWHNYGKSTIGNRADVERVPIDRLQAFYHKYYQPDNAVLTVSGKFDPAKVLGIINQKFGTIAKPARVLPPMYTVEPTQDGERSVTIRRVGDVNLVGTLYHVPSGSHPDFAPMSITQGLLIQQPSGRLYKNLIDTKLASSVDGATFAFKDPSFMLLLATVAKGKSPDSVKNILINTVEDFTAQKPTVADVERVKTKMLKDIELELSSSEQVGLDMSEYIAQGDWRLLFYERDQLAKVTPDDVMRVAGKYFKESNRSLGVFIPTAKPDRAEIEAAPDLNTMLKGYAGSQKTVEGEVFAATPANIQSRLTTTTALNGVTLNLLPKKNRGEAVNAQVMLHFGNESALQNKGAATWATVSLLDKGTKSKSRQQIQDEFDRLKAQVSFSGGTDQVTASIQTTRQNLPAVLQLVAEILKEPAFPANELDKFKTEQITTLEAQRSDPTAIAVAELSRYMDAYPKSDPRYVSTIDEQEADIKALTQADLENFHKSFFGASNANITVVGDFETTKVKAAIISALGDWKSPVPFARLMAKVKQQPAINKNFETPDKANAFFYGKQNVHMAAKDPDYPALVMANYMIGGGFLNSRLATRIRQKEGISYGVGSGLQADINDPNAAGFTFYAIYAPENLKRLNAAFKEEIDKVTQTGFTETELAEAKKGYLQSREVTLAQDASLAGVLNTYSFEGEKIAYWQKRNDDIAKLTLQQVNDAIKKHLSSANITIVKAGDFTKKKSETPSK